MIPIISKINSMLIDVPQWELNDMDSRVIDLALQEDLGQPYHDLTTETLFAESHSISKVNIISKQVQPIVMCGLPMVRAILAKIGGHCQLDSDYQDGEKVLPGATLLTLSGQAGRILMVERILLNFLQRLCAIATTTALFVQRVQHTHTTILDTRKTIPGWRHLEKYAVTCGGGSNHRMGLYDAVMIKDTHIDCLGGMSNALAALPNTLVKRCPIIVEVRTQEELAVVLNQGLAKISRVLLDNMSLPFLSDCVAACKGLIATEASGNVDLDNVQAIAECGVDFISIGKLTHSAGNIDLSMKYES